MNKVLLWGGRSQARIIHQMIKEDRDDVEVHLIFDRTLDAPTYGTNVPFINEVSLLGKNISDLSHFVVCMGGEHGFARVRTAEALEKFGLYPVSLISKYSVVEETVEYGDGIQVMPGAVIHKFATVGKQCIFNTNSTVDHECKIGDGVHIMPGASIAGRIKIGNYASVGTNATILTDVVIGEGAFIGAGAVVTKDVPPFSVVVGVPSKHLRTNSFKFDNKTIDGLETALHTKT